MSIVIVLMAGMVIIGAGTFFYKIVRRKTDKWEDPEVVRLKSELRQNCLMEISSEELAQPGTKVLFEDSLQISWKPESILIHFKGFEDGNWVHAGDIFLTVVMADRKVRRSDFFGGEAFVSVDPSSVSAIFVQRHAQDQKSSGGTS